MTLEVNLFDDIFKHCGTSSTLPPDRLRWVREKIKWNGATVFTDHLVDSPVVLMVQSPKKYLWLLESREITQDAYKKTPQFIKRFDKVFTHDRELLEKDPSRYIFAIPGSQRELQLHQVPIQVFPKTKMTSTISSQKTEATGHRLRHEAIKKVGDRMDVYGRGYRPIESVIQGLKDYRYSLTIENARYDYYFTEKILNCFFTGTVPIYWGCPSLGDFFDMRGVITFETVEELPKIMDSLSENDYQSRLPAIHENFKRAQLYGSAEEWMYDHLMDYLKPQK